MRRTERIARLGVPLVVTLAAIAQFQENRVAVSRDDYGGGGGSGRPLASDTTGGGIGINVAGALYDFRQNRRRTTVNSVTATSRRFLELLRTAQLTSLLNGNTVFVPENAAMQRFEANPQDEDALPDLLKGHIVQGHLSLESLRSSLRSGTRTLTLPTLKEGTSLIISLDSSDNVTVNGNVITHIKPMVYQGAYLFQINAVLFTGTENL